MRHTFKLGALAVTVAAAVAALPAFAQEAKKTTTVEKKTTTATAKAAPTDKKAAAPKIAIDPMTKDAGTIPKGEKIESVFMVKNEGLADLTITDARPSCGCTVASFDRSIKPGQTGRITASVDTKNFSGPITKTISVVSNDPEQPQLNLTIKAIVKPYVDVEPTQVIRFSATKGDTASNDLTLISSEKGFHPTIGEISQPYVKAEILPVAEKDRTAGKAGDQFKLHVTLQPNAPEGLLNVPIKVKTGIEKQPEIDIPVSGIVRSHVSVAPAVVTFGNFQLGKDTISRNVNISNNRKEGVKILRAETTVPGLSAEVVPVTEGMSYMVVIKPNDKIKKGEIDGKVKIYTTDKDQPVIEVPVKGTAL